MTLVARATTAPQRKVLESMMFDIVQLIDLMGVRVTLGAILPSYIYSTSTLFVVMLRVVMSTACRHYLPILRCLKR